tara:strand:- start:6928 stop:7110 length:183 start_codon:yes stop_codon:yes gene_type:complete
MSKRATTKGNTPKEQSQKLHAVSKKSSHTGALPLVESLTNKGCMVRPKVRQAQERRRNKI